jgi:aminoglycoside phosphotransferase (APT) family kinase protein
MPFDDLVTRARAAVASAGADPAQHGLALLTGGMTHHVFLPVEDPSLVVKVFQSTDRNGPEHEWDALVALAGSRIAPDPVHLDAGDPAIVVMTRVPGSSLSADALGAEHAGMIGSVHRLVHAIVPGDRRPVPHFSGLRNARTSLMRDESPWASSAHREASDVVARAWRTARTWITNANIDHLASPDHLRFTRGDPNLSNYFWGEEGLVLIDWEDSGYNDPALELADMAEHASTRTLDEYFWTDLADATELTQADRARVAYGRRLMACFWLDLIESRQRQGRPTTVTLEDQARRTLTILDP